ncbi:NUDIX hydrolase [Numidum massiliense]|uniref:NUDIX hydrolase n=1 Tax=Numidum massiliense TaxID=1522315 RepID=UPI0006D55D88|nr:NUDIX domain-containing protein [Numidum massiliense]
MTHEMLNIFDGDGKHLGVADREDVHRAGYWHETFHCWFVSLEADIAYIYLQIRSEQKDYPNLLDITVAGHLQADETIADGVREIKEEVGLEVAFEQLVPLGVIKDCIACNEFVDRELTNVFLYENDQALDDCQLQQEEVAGILRTAFDDFYNLWYGGAQEIPAEGFMVNGSGKKVAIDKTVGRSDFVPHEQVATLIRKKLLTP